MANTSRIELRATPEDRELMGRAAAGYVLVDRQHVLLDAATLQESERINARPARTLPGLVPLMERPSPFRTP
jgi:uncharacterized protein (DUF1778 family)